MTYLTYLAYLAYLAYLSIKVGKIISASYPTVNKKPLNNDYSKVYHRLIARTKG